jgi:hypothetical protein
MILCIGLVVFGSASWGPSSLLSVRQVVPLTQHPGSGGGQPASRSQHGGTQAGKHQSGSLSAHQPAFGPRQSPAFDLGVVSTQSTECSFNLGPRFLALVIKEGRVRIWSSADCARNQGSLITALRRGVPTVLPGAWAAGVAGRARVPSQWHRGLSRRGWRFRRRSWRR